MVRLHPSEFLGGDGCKTIGQEFDGEFDLFEQGVQLAEKDAINGLLDELSLNNWFWNISQTLPTYFLQGKWNFHFLWSKLSKRDKMKPIS